MSIFGPTISQNEQYVRHLAGMQGGTSPIDSEVKFEAEIATRSSFSNAVNAVWNGVSGTLSFGLLGSLIYPLASTNVRATILGATPEKVCEACGENAELLLNSCDWLSKRFTGFVQGAASFADSWGISENSVSNLFLGKRFVNKEAGESTWEGLNWLSGRVSSIGCSDNPEEYLQGCRVANYLGSVSGLVQWALNHPSTPYAVGFAVAGVALATFVSDANRAPESERYTYMVLSDRYHQILNTLNDMQEKEHYRPKDDNGMLTPVGMLAQGIVVYENKIYEEIDALELPNMGRIEKLRLVQPIIQLANEILEAQNRRISPKVD